MCIIARNCWNSSLCHFSHLAQTACLRSSSTLALSLASFKAASLVFRSSSCSSLFLIYELRVHCGLWAEIKWKCIRVKALEAAREYHHQERVSSSTIEERLLQTWEKIRWKSKNSAIFSRIHSSSDTRLMCESYLAYALLTAWLCLVHACGAVHMEMHVYNSLRCDCLKCNEGTTIFTVKFNFLFISFSVKLTLWWRASGTSGTGRFRRQKRGKTCAFTVSLSMYSQWRRV